MTNNVFHLTQSPFYRLNDDGSFSRVSMSEFVTLSEGMSERLFATTINPDDGKSVLISTVFLGVACDPHKPTLFETMIIGGRLDRSMWRYDTFEKANIGHQEIVSAMIAELGMNDKDERIQHERFHQGKGLH